MFVVEMIGIVLIGVGLLGGMLVALATLLYAWANGDEYGEARDVRKEGLYILALCSQSG